MGKSAKKKRPPEFTGIKMDRDLYERAKKRANQRHQSYSDYVRQLIVADTERIPEEVRA